MADVAVVTDSTAHLPRDLADRHGISVVPLGVVIGDRQGWEGRDIAPADVAAALAERPNRGRTVVTTSRPASAEFQKVYAGLLAAGAAGVVSVHLSAQLSSTYDAARVAAADFGDRVAVVDAGSAGMGLGFPALAAANAAHHGLPLAAVRDAADAAVARTTTLFYVDTLEYLRHGGRIGAAAALLGTALAVKPILRVAGEVAVVEKVRTASRAIARLIDLAAAAGQGGPVDAAVHHLASPDRAAGIAARLTASLPGLRELYVCEVGAAVAAHVGPGFAGVVVHRHR